MDKTSEYKTFDSGLRRAFTMGAEFGARYPEAGSWPEEELDLQYRAWRDSLAGNTWDADRIRVERTALLQEQGAQHPRYPEPRPARSEKQERLRRDPSSPGHDCDY